MLSPFQLVQPGYVQPCEMIRQEFAAPVNLGEGHAPVAGAFL
jgi:hypothetical protein